MQIWVDVLDVAKREFELICALSALALLDMLFQSTPIAACPLSNTGLLAPKQQRHMPPEGQAGPLKPVQKRYEGCLVRAERSFAEKLHRENVLGRKRREPLSNCAANLKANPVHQIDDAASSFLTYRSLQQIGRPCEKARVRVVVSLQGIRARLCASCYIECDLCFAGVHAFFPLVTSTQALFERRAGIHNALLNVIGCRQNARK